MTFLPFCHRPTHFNDTSHFPLEGVTSWPVYLLLVDCDLSTLGRHLVGINQGTKVFISLKILSHLLVTHVFDLV